MLEKKVKPSRPADAGGHETHRSQDTLIRKRSLRTRPVIPPNSQTLSRLSTLIETKNTREIEKIASSDINSSFDMISKYARGKPLNKQSFGNARHIEAVIHIRPWYLQPRLADQIEEDSKGYIRNATLPALIERLTTHDAPLDLTRKPKLLSCPIWLTHHTTQDKPNSRRLQTSSS